METKVNYSLAGIFVIVLIATIILTIIWLSSDFDTDEYQFYKVYMKESVSGLSQDGPVEFNGVSVGNIDEMQINRNNPRIIELVLKIKKDTPITEGTRAKLGMRALTGSAYILLEDNGQNMNPLLATKGEYAIIETVPSLYVRLESALTELNNNFQQLSKSMRLLLNDKNLHNFQEILESGQAAFELFETETLPAINQTMGKLGDLTNTLSDVALQIKQNPSIILRGKQTISFGPGER